MADDAESESFLRWLLARGALAGVGALLGSLSPVAGGPVFGAWSLLFVYTLANAERQEDVGWLWRAILSALEAGYTLMFVGAIAAGLYLGARALHIVG